MSLRISRKKVFSAAVATLGLNSLVSTVSAADRTWDGGGADNNWLTPANWNGDTVPNFTGAANAVNTDHLFFAGNVQTTTFNNTTNGNQTALTMTFASNAAAFTLDGNLIVIGTTGAGVTGNGNITNNSTNTVTFNAEVRQRTGLVAAVGGDFVFNGAFGVGNTGTFNQRTSNFSGAFNHYLHGRVTQAGILRRSGTGTLFITNDTNDYTGDTQIGEAGIIRISVPNALGGTGRTLIQGNAGNSGRLELVGGITFGPEAVTLEARQAASANAPHIVNVSGNNTWTGVITLTTGGGQYLITSEQDKLTLSGNINSNLAPERDLRFGGAAEGEVTGSIALTAGSHGMNVFKEGTGTWTLSGANTFAGRLGVNGGTLVINGSNATTNNATVTVGTLKITSLGSLASVPVITANPGTTFDVTDYAGSGGFNLGTTQTLAVSGTVKGQVNVGGGAQLSAGSLTTPAKTTFENGLSFIGGGIYNAFFNGSNHSTVNVTGGTLSATGANDLKVLGSGMAVGTYSLLDYTGALGGDGFGALTLAQLPPRVVANLVHNLANTSIDLNVTSVDFPKWTGATNGDWDINTTQNWKEVVSGNNTTYLQPLIPGDAVLFDDTASGTTVVNLTTTLAPTTVTVDNSAKEYSFVGNGNLTGNMSLTKNGTNRLVIGNFAVNDYTGGTIINAGTLQVGDDTGAGGSIGTGGITNNATLVFNKGDLLTLSGQISGSGLIRKQGTGELVFPAPNPDFHGNIIISDGVLRVPTGGGLGSTNGTTTVLSGGSFDVGGQQHADTILAQGPGYNGLGAITNSNGGQQNALQRVTLTGDATFGGVVAAARWDIRKQGTNEAFLSTGGNPFNLTKVGANQVSLVDVTVDPALGDININEGVLSFEVTTTGLGDPNKTVNIAGGATLLIWRLENVVNKKIVSQGGTIRAGSGTQNAIVSTIETNNLTTFQVDAGVDLTVSNVVSGFGGLTKTGTGTLHLLNGANTYEGPTTIAAGVLNATTLANGGVNSSIGKSGPATNNLVFSGGTLRYSGTTPANTDRLFEVLGNAGFDASGSAGAPLVFSSTSAATFTNSGVAPVTVTLTGSNKDQNTIAVQLSDSTASLDAYTALTKTGAGTWVLTNNNPITGNVLINGGVLKITNGGAIGTAGATNNSAVSILDGTANVNGGAQLLLEHPTGMIVSRNFITTGGGGGGGDALGPGLIRSRQGNNILTGTVTMTSGGGDSTFFAETGASLEFAGTITASTSNRTFRINGPGNGLISGVLSDGGANPVAIGKEGTGTWTVSGTNNTYTGATTVNEGILRVTGSIATSSGVTVNDGGVFDAAATQSINALTLNTGGTARVTAGDNKVLKVVNNNIAFNGGTLDLNSGLIVDYTAGNSPLTSIKDAIAAGYAGGAWNGTGIASTTAATTPVRAIGYGESATILGGPGQFMNQDVDGDAILARLTVLGDTNLDAAVTFVDLLKVAANFGAFAGNAVWTDGDINYDGQVTFVDLLGVAANFGGSLPASLPGASADFNDALAAIAAGQVPEPGAIGMMTLAAGAMALKRRRRA